MVSKLAEDMGHTFVSKLVKKEGDKRPMEEYEGIIAAAVPYLSRYFDPFFIAVVRTAVVVLWILKRNVRVVRGVSGMRNILSELYVLVKSCETSDVFTKVHGRLGSQLRRNMLDMIVKSACEGRYERFSSKGIDRTNHYRYGSVRESAAEAENPLWLRSGISAPVIISTHMEGSQVSYECPNCYKPF